MIFYGCVETTGDPYKPFYKTESHEEAIKVKGRHSSIEILKYRGHKRTRKNGMTSFVIKEILDWSDNE